MKSTPVHHVTNIALCNRTEDRLYPIELALALFAFETTGQNHTHELEDDHKIKLQIILLETRAELNMQTKVLKNAKKFDI